MHCRRHASHPQAEVIAKGMLRKTAELLFQSARVGYKVPRMGYKVPRMGYKVPRMGYKVLLTHVLNSIEYNYLQEPAIRSIQVI